MLGFTSSSVVMLHTGKLPQNLLRRDVFVHSNVNLNAVQEADVYYTTILQWLCQLLTPMQK